MAQITIEIPDDVLAKYLRGCDGMHIIFSHGDTLNGYGWHTQVDFVYSEYREHQEGPRRPIARGFVDVFKSEQHVIDQELTSNPIDILNGVREIEERGIKHLPKWPPEQNGE